MGHSRLGTLPQTKKWQDVVGLLESDAPLDAIAFAARASKYDLKRSVDDPGFQFVTNLLVRLPFLARAPSLEDVLSDLGIVYSGLSSLPGRVPPSSATRLMLAFHQTSAGWPKPPSWKPLRTNSVNAFLPSSSHPHRSYARPCQDLPAVSSLRNYPAPSSPISSTDRLTTF